MSLSQLPEDKIYNLLPSGLIDLDTQGLIQAVCGGIGDRIDDIRSYVSLFDGFVTGVGLPQTDSSGNPLANAVICQVQSPQGVVYSRSLNLDDTTPASTDTADLLTWAANLLQLDEDHLLLSAAYGVDMLRLVDANILAYLASTVGAVLYQTAAMDPDNAQSDARRLLQTWFPRLQYKGTAASFETFGRLLGFDDVRMMPLFSRLSPRIANDIGDPQNDQDFAVVPDYFPKQVKDNYYDPWVLNDGPFFTWTGTATALQGTNSTLFYTEVVNGFNPFITVDIVGTAPADPDPAGSPYILTGGGPEIAASVTPSNSGLQFSAICNGSSFNGLQINVEAIQNGSLTVLSITDQLSAIKYRSSYYDLALTMYPGHALAQFGTDVVTGNSDLASNPALANFGTAALSPYRPWQGGSLTQPQVVADWMTQNVSTGNLSVVAPRTQATLANRQFDMQDLSAAGAQVVQAMEEVRPATRTARHVDTGFLFEDQIGYANYCSTGSLLTTVSAHGTYWGTLTGFPLAPYNAEFGAYTQAQTGTIPMVGETDLINSGFVRFRSPDLSINGTYNYANATWLFAFNTVQSGTTIVTSYFPTSTQVIRPGPANGSAGTNYQQRPEDFLGTPTCDFADEYPWRRDLVNGGELIDLNTYGPATPDIQTVNLGQYTTVQSHTGAQYQVQVIVPGPYPPRFTVSESCLDNYVPGQRAIAYTGTFLNLAGPRPNAGTLDGGLDGVMQPGWQLYHFGLVQGVLVADPKKFYSLSHRAGLALWYPFNEQPLDPIEVVDHSVYAGNAAVSGINPQDRQFDPVRGNYLATEAGMSIGSTIFRDFNQKFAGGFWLRAPFSYPTAQVILACGPLQITLSGNAPTPQLNFYLNQPGGPAVLQATQVFNQGWVYVGWSFDGNQTLTINFWNSSGVLTSQTAVASTAIDFSTANNVALSCPLVPFDIQDLRLWNTTKQASDLTLTRYHSPTPTAVLYPVTWLESVNTYDHYAVRVLPSGFLVPDQLPTSVINDQLAWVQRYDYLGRYQAQSRYKETGIGSGNIPQGIQSLGAQWDTLTADGTLAVSTQLGAFVGVNNAWLFDSPAGNYIWLSGAVNPINGTQGVEVNTGTSVPWPNALAAVNTCRDRVWVKGDDGYTWEVQLTGTQNGNVSFNAQKLFSTSGSYQPTGAHCDLTGTQYSNRMSVTASGSVYAGVYTGTVTSAPLYLYANQQIPVSLTGTNIVNAWVEPNSFGLGQNPPVAALDENGQIAFQINQTLSPGFYRLQVTSGNIGNADQAFAGFNTLITVGDYVFQAQLCAGQSGANFSQTDTFDFYLNDTLTGAPSSWLLTFDWTNALNNQSKGTTRQLYISGVELIYYQPSLYQVALGPNALTTTRVRTELTNYSGVPGGWLATMSSWGTALTYTHESNVYSSNDTVQDPQPLSNKLGATTMRRREDIILTGSFTLKDQAIPSFSAGGGLTYVNNTE